MDFFALKARFDQLEEKIRSKKIQINEKYEQDVEKINEKYTQDTQKAYESGLNSYRENLLEKLQKELHVEIPDLDEFKEFLVNNIQKASNLQDSNRRYKLVKSFLETKTKDVRDNLFYLNLSGSFSFDVRLFKYEFSKPLDLIKLNKYSNLVLLKNRKFNLPAQVQINLELINYEKRLRHLVLPSNRIFIYARNKTTNDYTMMILDNDGNIMHSQRIKNQVTTEFKASSVYIFRVYTDIKESTSHLIVEIYDYKLKFVKILKLNDSYSIDLLIHKNEFAFEKLSDYKILIYNGDSFKSNTIIFQNKNRDEPFFSDGKQDRLINFNNQYLYLYKKSIDGLFIVIIDRATGLNSSTLPIFKKESLMKNLNFREPIEFVIKFDEDSNFYYKKLYETIEVRSSNGMELGTFNVKNGLAAFNFTFYGGIMFNELFNISSIKFEEY